MTESKKYTPGEFAAYGAVGAVVLAFFIAIIPIIAIPLTAYYVWCDMHLWNWFIVPYFGLPPMTLWWGVGMWTMISSIKTTYSSKEEPEEDKKWSPWKTFGMAILGHTATLLTGYLIHHYLAK